MLGDVESQFYKIHTAQNGSQHAIFLMKKKQSEN